MALNHNGRFLPIMIAAALFLDLSAVVAWGQRAGHSSENWCREDGCAHWWALYSVDMTVDKAGDHRITIRYRDTDFVIFDGEIKSSEKPRIKWTIAGRINKKEVVTGTVTAGDGKKELDDLFGQRMTIKDPPMGIKAIRVTGTRKTEDKTGDPEKGMVERPFKEDITQGKATEWRMEGAITVDIAGQTKDAAGADSTFEGTLVGIAELPIKGIFTPQPTKCSEVAGRARSDAEKKDQDTRLKEPRPVRPEAVAGRFRTTLQKDERNARIEERNARIAEQKARSEEISESPFEAESRKIKSQSGSEGPGRFSRRVSGTATKAEGRFAKIVLELPPLPVLDHKCSVREKVLPPGPLILVNQDATYRPAPRGPGDKEGSGQQGNRPAGN